MKVSKGRTKLEELSRENGLRSEIVLSGKSISMFNQASGKLTERLVIW